MNPSQLHTQNPDYLTLSSIRQKKHHWTIILLLTVTFIGYLGSMLYIVTTAIRHVPFVHLLLYYVLCYCYEGSALVFF